MRDSLDLDAGAGARRSGGRGPGSNKFGASSIRGAVFAAGARAVEPLRLGAALLQSLIMFFNTGLDVWVNYGLFDR